MPTPGSLESTGPAGLRRCARCGVRPCTARPPSAPSSQYPVTVMPAAGATDGAVLLPTSPSSASGDDGWGRATGWEGRGDGWEVDPGACVLDLGAGDA